MADITFEDYSVKCKAAINDATKQWLEEAGSELEAATKRNQTRVASGQTKGEWTHKVTGSQCVVGNPLQNAIYEEYGTGEYAAEGNGRKGGWVYRDAKGEFHRTKGKTPLRPLKTAFENNRAKIQKALEAKLKGMG